MSTISSQSCKSSAAIEQSALERFTNERTGEAECRKILRDWFPRLRERVLERKGADADVSDDEPEIYDAFAVLENIRWAFTAHQNYRDPGQSSLWDWPTEAQLLARPKDWHGTSPKDADRLAYDLAGYIERPWLQHNQIDGAAINALLFSPLAYWTELHLIMASGLSYALSGGNQLRMLWITPVHPAPPTGACSPRRSPTGLGQKQPRQR